MKYLLGAIIGVAIFAWLFSLCSHAGKNKTGHEYMPDMYHSVAYEANNYAAYHWNTWDKESQLSKASLSQPHSSVEGTIPRGYTAVYYGDASALDIVRGKNSSIAIAAPINGYAPFYYENTEEDRVRCEKELINNPFPIVNAKMEKAKVLYNSSCGICHGEKGDGQGYLYAGPDAKYPAAPKNLLADDMISAGNGRFYFAIMHGKNMMGAYADKLSFEERWEVIHYIRSLQAKSKNLEYNEKVNTLSNVEKPKLGVATGPVRTPQFATPPPAVPAN